MGNLSSETESITERIVLVSEYFNKSVRECAKNIDIPYSTFFAIVNGSEPKWSHLCKIIKAYNINPSWLLFGEGEMIGEGTPAPAPIVEKEPEEQKEVVTSAMNDLIKQNGQLIEIIANLSKK